MLIQKVDTPSNASPLTIFRIYGRSEEVVISESEVIVESLADQNANVQDLVPDPMKDAENVDPLADRNSNVKDLVADPLKHAKINCQIVEDAEIKEGDEVVISHNSNLVVEPVVAHNSYFEFNQSHALIAEIRADITDSILVNVPVDDAAISVDQQKNAEILEIQNLNFEFPQNLEADKEINNSETKLLSERLAEPNSVIGVNSKDGMTESNLMRSRSQS
ncbi:hypothetical protein MA16_Dca007834 [Dendrobium catenatum]|uniref:Uncharacterized protein n=1 Tax=Dendrobium catenatum TaxID=906689 RepID=A0A2I0X5J5_9ASPA|nr:hypothetical protein MA16_Dca007834 [Dendrobium catenatum]